MAESQTRQEPPEPTYEQDWVEVVVKPGQEEKVALWEWHKQHPNGEAFLVPGPPRFVALTPQVAYQIQIGNLRRAPEPAETLEEYLHKTNQKGEVTGEYHHIAKAPPSEVQAMRPRPRPTAKK